MNPRGSALLSAWVRIISVVVLVPGVAAPASADPPDVPQARPTVASAPAPQPPPTRDSLLNGTLIGAAVGFGAGYSAMAIANAKATESGPIWDSEGRGYYTMAGMIGAGIGAGIGALIDAMRKGPGRPQRRPGIVLTPVHGRGRTGAVLSIRY